MRRVESAILVWLQGAQPLPPNDLVQLWENYRYMTVCDMTWWNATKEATINEDGIHHIVCEALPELVRILQAYPLLYDTPRGNFPTLWEIRHVLNLSWDQLQTIVCPLRVSIGDNPKELERLFLSVSHRKRIRELCSDQSLKDLATGAMRLMIKLSNHQLPGEFYASAPCWGCVLRACPPCPDLLQTLREAEGASAISDPRRPYNNGNIHNVIEWLKKFPEPSWDLIARIQNLLHESKEPKGLYWRDDALDPEELWTEWRKPNPWGVAM
ncbi:hypothetical protein B0H14DRAFT_1452254 [Mycena olivaceomarginata]|nr:hypothetical protein B0H14DRAFT_1452254 [Mycena olivaceomarginata]